MRHQNKIITKLIVDGGSFLFVSTLFTTWCTGLVFIHWQSVGCISMPRSKEESPTCCTKLKGTLRWKQETWLCGDVDGGLRSSHLSSGNKSVGAVPFINGSSFKNCNRTIKDYTLYWLLVSKAKRQKQVQVEKEEVSGPFCSAVFCNRWRWNCQLLQI